MTDRRQIERWLDLFPAMRTLDAAHGQIARDAVRFLALPAGTVAYQQDWECPNYLMCLDGRTRVFKLSEAGRQILIYKVTAGGTCVLTTQCLLSGGRFPAESVAEADTELAALPAAVFRQLMSASEPFRRLVMDDCAALLSSLFALVDEVAFAPLEQRLARRLVAEADGTGVVRRTHQELAADVGSVREMVSRHLGEWERAGWIVIGRGMVTILNPAALVAATARPG